MDGGDLLWTVVVGAVMVVGLGGVVLPVVPGLAMMGAAALVYGFAVGWTTVGVAVMVLLGLLVAVSLITGVMVPRRAAATSGASGWSQVAALVGAVVGFFVIPVFGLIVGALIGLLAVEYLRTDDWGAAWAATVATARGFGVSILIDLGLGMVMIVAWSVWALTVLF